MENVLKKLTAYFTCILITMLIFSNQSFADSVTFVIKQKGTGDPVEGATVVLERTVPSEDVDYDQTNRAGRVSFSGVEYPQRIKVIAAGYEPSITTPDDKKSDYTIYLIANDFDGEVLEVSANRIIEKASKISLTARELKKVPGANGDPLKGLTALPGVVEAGEASSAVYLRGSDDGDNIFWVNRVPVGYIYHFGGFQSTLQPQLIEDINVFLGGFPVEYGNALGGVIDIKLRDPKNDRTHTYLDISSIASSFLVEGPVGESGDSYFIGGRRSYIDAIVSPSKFDSLSGNDDEDADKVTLVPRFYDFQALYHHKLDKGYLDTYIFAAGDEVKFDINGSAKADPQFAGALDSKVEYQTIGMTWRQIWSRKWEHIMTLAYYKSKSTDRFGRDDNGDPFFINTESNVYSWQPEFIYHPQQDSIISFGVAADYFEIPVNLSASRQPDENDIDFDLTSQKKFKLNKTLYVKSLGPYLKYRKNWTRRFSTTLGINYSYGVVSGGYRENDISPRINMEYQATKNTLLTASWGRFIQTPDGSQIIKVFGNPALEVTEAEHRILGVQYQINSLYSIKTEIYHKPMKNLVISLDDLEPPDNYSNQGSGEAYGLDLFIKRKPVDNRIGWLSVSLSKSTRTNDITKVTRDFSGDQPIRITAVWGQPFSGESWKYWDWSIKAQIHSGTPYTQVIGRYREDETDPDSRWVPVFGGHNAARTPTYFKLDLRIGRSYLFNESKLTMYLDMQNITFRQNVVEFDYGNEYEKIASPTEISGMGFFPFFGVAYEF